MTQEEEHEIQRLKELFEAYAGPIKFEGNEYIFSIVKQNKKRKKRRIPNELMQCELKFNDRPFGCFRYINQFDRSPEFDKEIHEFLNKSHYRYYILTKPNSGFYVYDKYQSFPYPDVGTDIKGMIRYLTDSVLQPNVQEREEKMQRMIREGLLRSRIKNEHLFNIFYSFTEYIRYSFMTNSYKFISTGDGPFQNMETELMRKILKSEEVDKMYRYGSLDTFKSTIVSGNYRMNCIFGMNDSSEISYVDNYFGREVEIDEDTDPNWIHNTNRKYISSCSEEGDDLNLWRFYGDNGKGMALELTVDHDHSSMGNTFFVGKVSYGEDRNRHEALNGIRAFVRTIERDLGEILERIHFNVWKHFFKPVDYASENEIRIFYLLPQQREHKESLNWTICDFGILNPFVDHNLKNGSTPFKITRVIRGPGMPYTSHNRLEMKAMLNYKGFGNLDVDNSEIGHYRST